ncbi:MAG: adenylyltransferase/cytidyltransferase family protein [Candidatus Nanohaloarchaea archaeon]|nr:adenylyltransferase/cytidyltransferase family protein [Candidatus Nanohaloarchaea archaeon]
MTRVMAQGVFDLLHPGHLHYLRESAALGDELHVVIARDSRLEGRKEVVMPEDARRDVVAALAVVDEAVLGSEDSIFDSVERIQPDVITLGYDQGHDEAELEEKLSAEGFDGVEVVRIGEYEGGIASSTELRNRSASRSG